MNESPVANISTPIIFKDPKFSQFKQINCAWAKRKEFFTWLYWPGFLQLWYFYDSRGFWLPRMPRRNGLWKKLLGMIFIRQKSSITSSMINSFKQRTVLLEVYLCLSCTCEADAPVKITKNLFQLFEGLYMVQQMFHNTAELFDKKKQINRGIHSFVNLKPYFSPIESSINEVRLYA